MATLTHNIQSTEQTVYLHDLWSDCEPAHTHRYSFKRVLSVNIADTAIRLISGIMRWLSGTVSKLY